MNESLRKEIVRHIFNRFGLLTKEKTYGFGSLPAILKDEFVLDKRIVFVGEAEKQYQNRVWATVCEIGGKKVQAVVADTKDDIGEFSILLRVDILPVYAMRLSEDIEDTGSMSCFIEHSKHSHWIEANSVVQARCLIGIETLSDQLLDWKKMDNYKEMYDLLIGFLKREDDKQ